MSNIGKLEAIWLKRMKGGPMDAKNSATLIANKGIAGNINQGGKRQVTILEKEVWDSVLEQVGASANPSARRANLLISGGLNMANTNGQILQIGNCQIRIYGETTPCKLMDKIQPGLREALKSNWGGGAFGEILNDANISVGDEVRWITE